jgi:hypothetical protein
LDSTDILHGRDRSAGNLEGQQMKRWKRFFKIIWVEWLDVPLQVLSFVAALITALHIHVLKWLMPYLVPFCIFILIRSIWGIAVMLSVPLKDAWEKQASQFRLMI